MLQWAASQWLLVAQAHGWLALLSQGVMLQMLEQLRALVLLLLGWWQGCKWALSVCFAVVLLGMLDMAIQTVAQQMAILHVSSLHACMCFGWQPVTANLPCVCNGST